MLVLERVDSEGWQLHQQGYNQRFSYICSFAAFRGIPVSPIISYTRHLHSMVDFSASHVFFFWCISPTSVKPGLANYHFKLPFAGDYAKPPLNNSWIRTCMIFWLSCIFLLEFWQYFFTSLQHHHPPSARLTSGVPGSGAYAKTKDADSLLMNMC